MRAGSALRDLLAQQCEHEKAAIIQQEFLECQVERLRADHTETLAARADLALLLLNSLEHHKVKEV